MSVSKFVTTSGTCSLVLGSRYAELLLSHHLTNVRALVGFSLSLMIPVGTQPDTFGPGTLPYTQFMFATVGGSAGDDQFSTTYIPIKVVGSVVVYNGAEPYRNWELTGDLSQVSTTSSTSAPLTVRFAKLKILDGNLYNSLFNKTSSANLKFALCYYKA